MRILLDENLPVALAPQLAGHDVATVADLGWQGVKNSELLRRAEKRFDALLTMDQNLEFQQNIAGFKIAVLLLVAPSNRLVHLSSLLPVVLTALKSVRPGQLLRVGS